jgi:polyhydroxybutyrate depolymerase
MHGTDDEFAPYRGGRGARSLTQTDFYSVDYSIQCWVKANGCQLPPRVEQLKPSVEDGTHVTCATYAGGKEGAEVVLYTIHGAGHTWPGRVSPFTFLGKTTANLSANEVMWEFFQRHPLPAGHPSRTR